MKNILIIGATSAIAKECAKIWAERDDKLFLVARNEENLKQQSDIFYRIFNQIKNKIN